MKSKQLHVYYFTGEVSDSEKRFVDKCFENKYGLVYKPLDKEAVKHPKYEICENSWVINLRGMGKC